MVIQTPMGAFGTKCWLMLNNRGAAARMSRLGWIATSLWCSWLLVVDFCFTKLHWLRWVKSYYNILKMSFSRWLIYRFTPTFHNHSICKQKKCIQNRPAPSHNLFVPMWHHFSKLHAVVPCCLLDCKPSHVWVPKSDPYPMPMSLTLE